ncbi:MAG: hypothetical protein RLZZ131_131 [Actinomycetota bacterium]
MNTKLSTKKRLDLTLVAVALLMALITFTLREIANQPRALPDFESGMSEGSTTLVIESGESGSEIAKKLESAGVIKSAETFFRLAVGDSRSSRIAPGTYRLETKIPAAEALEQLLDLDRVIGLISVRDGARLDEVVTLLEENGFKDVRTVLEKRKPQAPFTFKSLEGFLYPAKYSFEPGAKADDVIDAMTERFYRALAENDLNNLPQGISPDEFLIIASIVEAEGTPDVFSKIARVIYNRLERKMALQMDSTVHYIKRERGNIALSLAATKIDSPYNTYQRQGLPPGPIGSPTSAAMRATLNPEAGDWLYFITVAPKETRFTKSYDEFLQWKELYRKNYKAGLFDD